MEIIKKASAPLIITFIALIFVIFGFAGGQRPLYMVGSFAFLIAGVIATLSALDVFNKSTRNMILMGLVVVSIGLAYLDFMAIKEPLDFEKEKKRRYSYVIQNLKDLRQAQMAYKTRFGGYAGSIDSLMNFVKYDSVLVVNSTGTVPDGLTREQALDSGYVVIDTVKVPAGLSIFTDKYLSDRKVPFNMDSLATVPFSDVFFTVEAGIIERSKVKVPVFLITDADPFDPSDVMMVGSLTDPTTSGNWGE